MFFTLMNTIWMQFCASKNIIPVFHPKIFFTVVSRPLYACQSLILLSKERRSWWENRFEFLLFSLSRSFCNRLLMIIVHRPLFTFENFLQSMSMFSTSMLHQGVVFHSSMDVLRARLGCSLKFFLDVGITKIFLSGIEVLHAQMG